MDHREQVFTATISLTHGIQHFFMRLLPPLIPVWGVEFGYPLWKLGALVGVLSLGSAVGQAPFGVLSDRYDRRYILTTGVAITGLCFAAFAAAPALTTGVQTSVAGFAVDDQFAVMAGAVFVAGLGIATLHPVGYPLITANVDAANKGRALGMWGSAAKFGDGIAPAAVGLFLLVVSWDLILASFGLLAVVYSALLFSVLSGYETDPRDRSGSGDTDSLSVIRSDPRLYVYPMALIFLFFAIRGVGSNGVNTFIPEFVTDVYGYSVTVVGFTVTPESTASFYYSALMLTAGFVQLGTGRVVEKYDSRLVILGFLSVSIVALVVLATVALSPVALFLVMLVFGGAMWGMAPARDVLISNITPTELEGRTFGYLWTGIGLVTAVSPIVVGFIADVAGLRSAFGLLAIALALSAVPVAALFSDRLYVPLDTWRSNQPSD